MQLSPVLMQVAGWRAWTPCFLADWWVVLPMLAQTRNGSPSSCQHCWASIIQHRCLRSACLPVPACRAPETVMLLRGSSFSCSCSFSCAYSCSSSDRQHCRLVQPVWAAGSDSWHWGHLHEHCCRHVPSGRGSPAQRLRAAADIWRYCLPAAPAQLWRGQLPDMCARCLG